MADLLTEYRRRLDARYARIQAKLPEGWVVCTNCHGAGEYFEGGTRGPLGAPTECPRCHGEGAVRA